MASESDRADLATDYKADDLYIGIGNTVTYYHAERGLQVGQIVVTSTPTAVEVAYSDRQGERHFDWVPVTDVTSINGKPVRVTA
jgi:hypothetical protein